MLDFISRVKTLMLTYVVNLKIQLVAVAIVGCILIVLYQVKPLVQESLTELHQKIQKLEQTGNPGGAKSIPCESHHGKYCASGVFGSAIAQMHGCCGSVSSVGTTSDSNP